MRERRSKNAFNSNDLLNHVQKRIILQPSLCMLICSMYYSKIDAHLSLSFSLYPRVNLYLLQNALFFLDSFVASALKKDFFCLMLRNTFFFVYFGREDKNSVAWFFLVCFFLSLSIFSFAWWDFVVLYFSKNCSKFTFSQTHWPCMVPTECKQESKQKKKTEHELQRTYMHTSHKPYVKFK